MTETRDVFPTEPMGGRIAIDGIATSDVDRTDAETGLP